MFPLFHVWYSIPIHNKLFCTSHDKSISCCWSSKHLIWHYRTNMKKSTTTLRVRRGVNKKWSQQLPLLPCIPPLTRQHEDSLFYPSLASVQPTILLPSSSLVYIRKKHKTWTQRGNYGYVDISALDKIAQWNVPQHHDLVYFLEMPKLVIFYHLKITFLKEMDNI